MLTQMREIKISMDKSLLAYKDLKYCFWNLKCTFSKVRGKSIFFHFTYQSTANHLSFSILFFFKSLLGNKSLESNRTLQRQLWVSSTSCLLLFWNVFYVLKTTFISTLQDRQDSNVMHIRRVAFIFKATLCQLSRTGQ